MFFLWTILGRWLELIGKLYITTLNFIAWGYLLVRPPRTPRKRRTEPLDEILLLPAVILAERVNFLLLFDYDSSFFLSFFIFFIDLIDLKLDP